eukprot:1157685-Pelagomonas_calceolata.AAC.6
MRCAFRRAFPNAWHFHPPVTPPPRNRLPTMPVNLAKINVFLHIQAGFPDGVPSTHAHSSPARTGSAEPVNLAKINASARIKASYSRCFALSHVSTSVLQEPRSMAKISVSPARLGAC